MICIVGKKKRNFTLENIANGKHTQSNTYESKLFLNGKFDKEHITHKTLGNKNRTERFNLFIHIKIESIIYCLTFIVTRIYQEKIERKLIILSLFSVGCEKNNRSHCSSPGLKNSISHIGKTDAVLNTNPYHIKLTKFDEMMHHYFKKIQ